MDNIEKTDNTVVNQILSSNESLDTSDTHTENISNDSSTENINTEPELNTVEKTDANTEKIIESSSEDSNPETKKIETETFPTTNCLALTIKEEHKLVAVKNVFFHSLKVSWKVIASTIALHILKIFF